MKAKSKVLLGLIVALAMMVFAVPAFAATTITDLDKTTQEVYAGAEASFSFKINGTSANTYSLSFADAKTPGAFAPAAYSYTPETLSGETVNVTVKVKTDASVADQIGDHNVTFTVTDNAGGTASMTTKITVKAAPTVTLSGYDAPASETATQLEKAGLKVGDPIGLNVVAPEGKTATYEWQMSKTTSKEGADDPASDKWEKIGENDITLNTPAKIEDNGKFVRCLVTVDGTTVVAKADLNATTYTKLDMKTVKLTVADATKVTVTTQDVTSTPAAVKPNYEFYAGAANALSVKATAAGGTLDPTKPAYTYKWTKDGKDITADDNTTLTEDGAQINFVKVTKDTAGTYQCVVSDQAEPAVEGKSESFVIAVNPTPTMVVENSSVTKKAAYVDASGNPSLTTPTLGSGVVSYTADDVTNGMTLTAKVDGMQEKGYSWWKRQNGSWRNITGASSASLDLTPADMAAIQSGTVTKYNVRAAFDGLEKDLEFEVSFKAVAGTLSEGIVTSTDGGKTLNPNPVFTVSLPAGYNFPEGITANTKKTAAEWKTAGLTVDPLANSTDTKISGAKIEVIEVKPTTTKDGVATMKFRHEGLTDALSTPFSADMQVAITGATGVTEVTPSPTDINLPVSNKSGYKISVPAKGYEATSPTTKNQIDLKGAATGTVTEKYSGKAVEAEVVSDEGVGAADTIRYVQKETFPEPADIAQAKADAPVDAGTYWVICNIANGEKYGANTDQVAGKIVISKISDLETATDAERAELFKIDPKSNVFNGKVQEPKVTFADGVTKAGEIDKISYKKAGTSTAVTPKEVGKYDVYVTTKNAPATGANIATETTPVKVGVYEITKTEPTADLYTMTPDSAVYTGTILEPKITAKEGAGEVKAVHYYAEGSDEEVDPIEAGKYTVKVDVAESENYAAKEGLEIGTFTIKKSASEQPKLYMAAHVQYQGWDKKLTELSSDKPTADLGTTGRGWRVEAVDFYVPEDYQVVGFAHVQYNGDTAIKEVTPDYEAAKQAPEGYKVYRFGTTGEEKRVEAVCIGLQDASGKYVDGFQYASHLAYKGWQGYVRNGSFSGSRGMELRMECLRFVYKADDIVPAGEPHDDAK